MTDQSSSSSPVMSSAQTESSIQYHKQRPPFLRRCSISDPHLDIVPHFMKEEKSFNPINRMFSGLFEKGSNFSINSTESTERADLVAPFPTSPNISQEQLRHQFPKGNSAIELKNIPSSAPTPTDAGGMRKSASSVSALFSTSPQSTHLFPEDHGRLEMSAGPNSSLSKQIEEATKAAHPASEAANLPKPSGFKSLFAGGFLSRPVLHSQEENYRILMALDR